MVNDANDPNGDREMLLSFHRFAQDSITTWQTKIWEVQSILIGIAGLFLVIAELGAQQTIPSYLFYFIAWGGILLALISSGIMGHFANLYIMEAQHWENKPIILKYYKEIHEISKEHFKSFYLWFCVVILYLLGFVIASYSIYEILSVAWCNLHLRLIVIILSIITVITFGCNWFTVFKTPFKKPGLNVANKGKKVAE